MSIIHPHWSQFPPVNPLIGHFFGIMFFFLWIMSFIGNGCVIYIFLKVKNLRTPVSETLDVVWVYVQSHKFFLKQTNNACLVNYYQQHC
jgi:hypothetical protein